MKANTTKKTSAAKKSDSKILLSIGLIVKNEERYLGKCLEALKPITNTGKVEVVVVDTGSTDKTVSIAKKYTDNVYDFKWIDDFAAARNYGLDRCVGEWFMFLDADEIFDESIVEILKFIESPDAKNYNSVAYHIRNYTDETFARYEEFVPTRMGRRNDTLRFAGAIHESLSFTMPTKNTNAVAYHYGYLGSKLLLKKSDRNLKRLYKDYENDPTSPRTLMYIFNGLTGKNEKEKYLKEWIELADSSKEDKLTMLAYLSATQFYFQIFDYRKSAFYAEKMLKVEGSEKNIKSLMAYHYMGDSYVKLLNFDLAVVAYEKYFKKYREYKDGKLEYYATSILSGITDFEYESKMAAYAFCLVKDKKYGKAIKTLKKLDFSKFEEDGYLYMRYSLCELCELTLEEVKFADFEQVLAKYFVYLNDNAKKALKNAEDVKANEYICDYKLQLSILVSDIYWEMRKEKKRLGKAPLSDEKVKSVQIEVFNLVANTLKEEYYGLMFQVITLLIKQNDEVGDVAKQVVGPFLDNLPNCLLGYSPIIWLGMQNGCSLCSVLSHSDRKVIEDISASIAVNVEDYHKSAKEFADTYQPETIKELYFEIALLRRTLTDYKEMWYPYSMLLANYVSNIYTEDILNEDDITVLSDEERLGFYMYKADQSLQEDDKVRYIHFLRLALKVCPGMKESIKEIADGMDIGEEEK